ncbi:GNAT family N-acetyltransferase [Shouchella sp. JSM 1781072]|uniref:GNAT family N-acetyltransferase n=1 Tax=Shouchella sp. JSM 1781072 TaxID=3344581 RepID=UPI0035C04C95
MMQRLSTLTKEQLAQAATLYTDVWQEDQEECLARFQKHATYPHFHSSAMMINEQMIGFIYGYTSQKGQYYHDLLANHMDHATYLEWLSNCFEVVELLVHPTYRQRGIATTLLHQLLNKAPNQTALLTTQQENMPARMLYEHEGWTLISDSFIPQNSATTYVIYGKKI